MSKLVELTRNSDIEHLKSLNLRIYLRTEVYYSRKIHVCVGENTEILPVQCFFQTFEYLKKFQTFRISFSEIDPTNQCLQVAFFRV